MCLLIIIGIIAYTYQYIMYEKPININNTYSGVKFSVANTGVLDNVEIKIVGQYTKLHGSQDRFNGDISVGDIIINYDDELTSVDGTDTNIASINTGVERNFTINKQAILTIYLNKEMTKVCIGLGDKNGSTGIFISAPCNKREDGIQILDELFK